MVPLRLPVRISQVFSQETENDTSRELDASWVISKDITRDTVLSVNADFMKNWTSMLYNGKKCYPVQIWIGDKFVRKARVFIGSKETDDFVLIMGSDLLKDLKIGLRRHSFSVGHVNCVSYIPEKINELKKCF